jgi:hypothetical protein
MSHLFLDVAFEPAMSISCVQEVDLAPFERSSGPCSCIACIRLHTPNIACQHHVVLQWAVTTVTLSPASRSCGNDCGDGAEPL